VPVPKGNLSEMVSHALGESQGVDLMNASMANAVHRFTGSEARTRPLMANIFWQSFIGHPLGLESLLAQIREIEPNFRPRVMQVVWHGREYDGRADLVILGTGLRDPEHTMIVRAVDLSTEEARHGWAMFHAANADAVQAQRELMKFLPPWEVAASACALVQGRAPFRVLVVESDHAELTLSVPQSPLRVEDGMGGVSTAGVIAKDPQGRVGVTAALHAVKDSRAALRVDGRPGSVLTTDMWSDSAFVEVPGVAAGPPVTALSGMVPRVYEEVSFYGAVSGQMKSQVRGVDPRLPFVSRNAQLVITTDLVTARGDSGSALFDGTGKLLGFAHERTDPGARNPYSSWIWAELVILAHQLS
jgi:hypothetical protein